MTIQYRFVNALNAVSATVRARQSRSCARLPRSPASIRCAALPGGDRGQAPGRAGLRPRARSTALRGRRQGRVASRCSTGRSTARTPTCTISRPGWNAVAGKPQAGAARPGRRRRTRTAMAGIVAGRGGPRRPARRRAGRHARCRSRSWRCSTASSWARPRRCSPGIDRALDPNGDGNLSDHADVILAPVAEPFAAFGASAETVAAEGVERPARVLVAAAGNDGADRRALRHDRVAGGLAGLARGRRHRRPRRRCRRVNVTLATDGPDAALDDVPLAGRARARRATRRSPLVLPAGPTQSDSARAPADVVSGTAEGDFRAPDGTSLVSGKAVLMPRDGAPIAQRAAAASAAGAKRARALRRRRRAARARSASTIA